MRTTAEAVTSVRAATVIAVVALIALGIRLWGIDFGLPYAYHVDEPTYVSQALNLGAGIIGRQPNPTAFSNILFIEYALYYLGGRLGGAFPSSAAFEQAYRADISPFLLLARVTSAGLGTLGVVALYWLGSATRGRVTGIVAACLLAVAFLHVRDSHFGVPDVAAVTFTIVASAAAVESVQRGSRRYLVFGSLAAGLAVATKWSLVWAILPVLVAAITLVLCEGDGHRKWRAFFPTMVLVALGLGAGLLLGGFQLVLQPLTYLEYALRESAAGEGGGFGLWQIDRVPGWIFYLQTLVVGVGLPMLVLALTGLIHWAVASMRRKATSALLVLVFPIAYFLFMGATRHYFARYALPLVPFVALFAAAGIVTIAQMIARGRPRVLSGVTAVLVAACVAQPLSNSLRLDLLLTRKDTRTQAKEWIEANVPSGSRVAVDWPFHGPPLSSEEVAVPYSEATYNVTVAGGTGLADFPIAHYTTGDFDYLVTSSFISQISVLDRDREAERREFYGSLDEVLELGQSFSPFRAESDAPFVFDEIYAPFVGLWSRASPGPLISIYRIPSR